jgi:hypothetical protein
MQPENFAGVAARKRFSLELRLREGAGVVQGRRQERRTGGMPMIFKLLLGLASLLTPAALVLFGCLWWPHRKTAYLSCVPWILGAFVFGKAAGILTTPLIHRFADAGKMATNENIAAIFTRFTVAIISLDALFFVVIALMISANAAFLLEKANAPANPLQERLARLHRFQPWMGSSLLGLKIVMALAVVWVARLVLQ